MTLSDRKTQSHVNLKWFIFENQFDRTEWHEKKSPATAVRLIKEHNNLTFARNGGHCVYYPSNIFA